MRFFSAANSRPFGIFLLITVFACLPIWAVDNFVNQDGLPHLYNAFLIVELLRDNPAFTEFYALNSAPIPNMSGHYLLAFLLLIFSPPIVTKIMVTFTFAGVIAAAGWLRFQTAGREGLTMAFLIGAALAFNWMWFLGFYNFIIGAIGFTITLGLYWRWRDALNLPRSLILSALFVVVFFSHLISFAMLVGSVLVVAVTAAPPNLKRAFVWTIAAIVPVLPLVVGYKLMTEAGGGAASPVWQYLDNPFSPSNWFLQLQTADPFQLLSRKGFPFVHASSNLFAVFSPFLWIVGAFVCLAAATWFFNSRRDCLTRQSLPFFLITGGSILFWIFAPDHFGKSHGSFLRERVLLCGLLCFIPLYRAGESFWLRRAAAFLLVFVIFFQTFSLWEYSLRADSLADEYLAARSLVGDDDRFGSIAFIENGCRYKSNPVSQLGVLYGVGKQSRVWDNYEIGYYLFPVTAKNPSDREFAFDFREASSFELCDPNEKVEEKLNELNRLIGSQHERINVILIWNGDDRPIPFLKEWYEPAPFYENGRVKLYRHR